jgi:4'-phosphopantetheinyl transferase
MTAIGNPNRFDPSGEAVRPLGLRMRHLSESLSRQAGAAVCVADASAISVARCEELLDKLEIQRADRFVAESDRRAFIVTRAGLRCLLGSITGIKPREFRFGTGAWGKPFIADPIPDVPIDFSVSHSGSIGLIAAAVGRRIGLDIERLREVEGWDAIATETFGAGLSDGLAGLTPELRTKLFLRYWTVGEAFSKAAGLGLAGLSGVVPIQADCAEIGRVRIVGGPAPKAGMEWSVVELDVAPGYVASMIVELESHRSAIFPTVSPFTLPSRFQ